MNRPLLSRLMLAAGACAGACLVSLPAPAAEGLQYKISGYGTLGATVTNENDVQFRTGLEQRKGADSSLDLGTDSRIAVQGQVLFQQDFSLMAQVQAARRTDKDFDPDVEWLFAQYSGIANTDLRLGRMVLPAFLVSDSRFVGYALPWARVPVLVYSMMPISTVDGLQAVHRLNLGPAVLTGQVSYGRTSLEGGGDVKRIVSANLTAEYGSWTARVGYVGGKVHTGTIPDFKDRFTGLGLQYDNGSFFVTSELVKRKTAPGMLDSSAWYLGGGVRLGKWTPYAIVSRFRPGSNLEPAFYVPTPFGPQPVLLQGPDTKTKGTQAGVRYELLSNVAMKAEIGRYDGRNTLIFFDPANPSGPLPASFDKAVNTFSFNVDFVF